MIHKEHFIEDDMHLERIDALSICAPLFFSPRSLKHSMGALRHCSDSMLQHWRQFTRIASVAKPTGIDVAAGQAFRLFRQQTGHPHQIPFIN